MTVESGDDNDLARLSWRETGASAVPPPARRGCGTRMVERSVSAELGGTAALHFEQSGVTCALQFHWRRFVSVIPEGLSGARVFVVEDEFAVLLMVEDMLVELGCALAGTASRMGDAVRMAKELGLDAAVLDVNINGETVTPVAEILAERGIPIVFSTGYGRSGLDPRWRDRPVLQKPYRLDELAVALRQALSNSGTGQ